MLFGKAMDLFCLLTTTFIVQFPGSRELGDEISFYLPLLLRISFVWERKVHNFLSGLRPED